MPVRVRRRAGHAPDGREEQRRAGGPQRDARQATLAGGLGQAEDEGDRLPRGEHGPRRPGRP
eukprot:2737443-Pyramimonas_sp.AAC.1